MASIWMLWAASGPEMPGECGGTNIKRQKLLHHIVHVILERAPLVIYHHNNSELNSVYRLVSTITVGVKSAP